MRRDRGVAWPHVAATAAAGLALAAAVVRRRRRRAYAFEGRTVLITGGSRGLGLVLARAFVARGASVAIMARRAAEVANAVEEFGANAPVLGVTGDVRDPESCALAVDAVLSRFGRLDVLVNNAGVILSAPLLHTTVNDFRALMDVHFWGTLHMTSAVLPHLLTHRESRVVNICSIGGKVAVPHLSAYSASKFAQAGFSAVLGQELRRHGVKVTTVYPGLMRTGSHVQARFRGDVAREYQLFALAAGTPVTAMNAERAAQRVLRAAARGDAELTFPLSMKMAAATAALAPKVTASVLAGVTRWLPDGNAPAETEDPGLPVRGAELPLGPAVRAAIRLGDRAADRNNERGS